MSDAYQRPSIVVVHGDLGGRIAERVRALALPSAIIYFIEAGSESLPSGALELAGRVVGNTTVEVVHLLGSETHDQLTAVLAGVVEVNRVLAHYPALQCRHFVVQVVRREYSDVEMQIGTHCVQQTSPQVAGNLIISRSSEANAHLEENDEVQMAADAVHILLTTSLAESLINLRVVGLGVTSVVYRREPLVSAIAAYHAVKALDDTLLAPAHAVDPHRALGRQWAKDLHEGSEQHLIELLRDATGGSVLRSLRIDAERFAHVPLEALPDALGSFCDDLLLNKMADVYRQMERNGNERTQGLLSRMEKEAVSVVRESKNLESAREYWLGTDAALVEITQELQVDLTEGRLNLPDPDSARLEMERLIRHLAYPAAVFFRVAAFAVLGLLFGSLFLFNHFGEKSVLEATAGFGLLSGIPLVLKYLLGRRKIRLLVRRFLERTAAQLQRQCERHSLELALREVTQLRQRIFGTEEGSEGDVPGIVSRLDMAKERLVELRERYLNRIETRGDHPLASSTLSLCVPSPAECSTEWLADKFQMRHLPIFADALVAVVFRNSLEVDVDDMDRRIVELVAPQLDGPWEQLDELPNELPATFDRAGRLLATRAAPILRRSDMTALEEYSIRRQLCVSYEFVDTVERAFSRSSSSTTSLGELTSHFVVEYGGVLDCSDPSIIALTSLVELSPIVKSMLARGRQ